MKLTVIGFVVLIGILALCIELFEPETKKGGAPSAPASAPADDAFKNFKL